MASFETCIKGAPRRDGTWNLKLRITHHRDSRWLPTNITVHADEVTRKGAIKSRAILDKAEDLLRAVRASASKLSPFALEDMTVDQLAEWIRRDLSDRGWRLDFRKFCMDELATMTESTAASRRAAVNSFFRWKGVPEMDINDLRSRDILDWSDSLEPKACAVDYPRVLATLFRIARRKYNDPDAEKPLIPRDPFEGFDKKAPARQGQRPLSVEELQAFMDLHPENANERWSRDLFVLSFALFGANMADMYELEPPVDGWLRYLRKKVRRKKTARAAEIQIRVPEQIAPLVERYRNPGPGPWLSISHKVSTIKNASILVDKYLHRLQERYGLKRFSFNAARHTFGTLAHSAAGIDIDTVDEAMSHNGYLPLARIYIERDWSYINDEMAKLFALFRWPDK